MISTLEVLKKKMVEKPWLYETEEHVVLKLAEDAVEFIRSSMTVENQRIAELWLKEHE